MNALTIACRGFCPAMPSEPCREFGTRLNSPHPERIRLASWERHYRREEHRTLFIYELDGLTADTAAQAHQWQQERQEYLDESYAESGWLRAAEYDPIALAETEADDARAAAFGAW